MSTSRDSPSSPIIMTNDELAMAMLQANADFHNQDTQFFDDCENDEVDHQIKPGIGETVRNVLSEAIKYVCQRLVGLFGRS
jgi:hypothetical protein